MVEYYKKRALEYERIYGKPERQESLALLKARVTQLFSGKSVLEIACGTGYWTEVLARSARSVSASDINEAVLEIARQKPYGQCPVSTLIGDAYSPRAVPGCDSAFAGFWFSHVEKSRRAAFIQALHAALPPGSLVCLVDNRFVEGSSTPISRIDPEGNSWQDRKLDSGETHEVIKNFPSEGELASIFGPCSAGFEYESFGYYWLISYKVA